MKVIYLFLFSFLFLFASSTSQAQALDHVPGELIVQLIPGYSFESITEQDQNIEGIGISLKLTRMLSRRLHIGLIHFDAKKVDENRMLKYLRFHPAVQIAQYNHSVELRATTPDDPEFPTMWGMHNTGAGGGVADADIDAPEAWDIATGGLTSQGDTIVVAIVDGGFDLTHEDIAFYKNRHEIPGNSIDDDGNGYVDDYDGWNAYDSNGDLSNTSGTHGTHVAGTAAAKGNNAIGVTGVNWDARVMPVRGSSGDEATVVEAYGYIFEMRAKYNETSGDSGAFVVSTNSSFGVNFGLPADYPIWCAMYDSLGAVGILSATATMNTSADVDVDSDIPTACPSPWMVAVTNTTNTDNINSGAAWGLTTIDLGAPGTNILSTVPGNSYSSSTGTSMATPHVCGAIALLYSAACPDFITDYKADPETMSLVIRDFLFDGTDSIPDLIGNTVSGGRLNLFNSLILVQDFCAGGSGCFTPYGLGATAISDTSATLTWANITSALTYEMRWKAVGDTVWTTVTTVTNSLDLGGLSPCASYEFQVESVCDTVESTWSSSYLFASEGCCTAPASSSVDGITDTTATTSWSSVFAASSYTIELRPLGGSTWTSMTSATTTFTWEELEPCTEYEFRVETDCEDSTSNYSPILTFTTKGCGLCVEGGYCGSMLNATDEYMESFAIGSYINASGDNGGYGDFTGVSIDLHRDSLYATTFIPGFNGTAYAETWRVWVDINQNGVFDNPGELLSDEPSSNTTVTSNLMLPITTPLGISRMRVMMKWNFTDVPCTDEGFGEVEDYCINVLEEVSGVGREENYFNPNHISVFPNPTQSQLQVNSAVKINRATVLNPIGQILRELDLPASQQFSIDMNDLPKGLYLIRFASEVGSGVKRVVKN